MKRWSWKMVTGRRNLVTRIGAALAVVVTLLLAPFPAGRAFAGEETRGVFDQATARSAVWSAPVLSHRLNQDWYPKERAIFTDKNLQEAFPNLGENFEVQAPHTPEYNCIAHSLGDHHHWINPPAVGPEENPLVYADAMYAAVGYTREGGLDFRLESGKQKVILYGTVNADGTFHAITHAALQEADGTWTSKMGSLALIRHEMPQDLRGFDYGLPIAVYVRAR